jgi:tetratricopeptide (TPR) repeat protein
VDKKEILSNDDWEEARKLHAGFFASFSAEREDALDGENQNLIYAEIGEEIENIRAGWQWSVAHRNFDFISKYIKCLDSYYILKGWFSNGEKTFLRTIEFLKAQNPSTVEEQSAVEAIVGRFLSSRGWFCRFLARYEEASQALKESVAVFRRMGMEKELAGALYRLGVVMSEYAQKEEAKKHFEESYRIMQKQNDPRSLKNATRTLGIFYILCDDLEKAREMFETCLHLCIETGDRLTQVKILTNLGLVKEAEENYGEAVDLHQESLAICRQIGGLTSTVNNLINLGFAFLSGGRSQEARKCFLESLNLAGKTRVQSYIHEALLGLAALRSQDGENEIALEIVGHVCSHPLMLWMQRRVDRLISELKPKFDEEAFLKIMEKGKQRELDHYIKFFSC